MVGYKKIKGDEYIMDLNSLGLSLVDDLNQIEILYMSITRLETQKSHEKKNQQQQKLYYYHVFLFLKLEH